MLSKNEIREQILQAIDLIEENTHKTIWRTSMRIHDLCILSNPNWQNNQFLAQKNNFLHLLHMFCFSDSITAIGTPGVQQLGEKYEESVFEPILFGDVHIKSGAGIEVPEKSKGKIYSYTPTDVRSIIVERKMIDCMRQGLNFDEANIATGKMTSEERAASVEELIKNGMVIGNIFYKYPQGTKDTEEESLPQLPAYI